MTDILTPEIMDPTDKLDVGEVKLLGLQKVEHNGEYFERLNYAVGDENDPREAAKLRKVGDRFEDFLAIDQELKIDDNIAADWLYREDPSQTSMLEWRKLFPTAKALFPLQRLNEAGLVLPNGEIDERALYLFTNMIDGIDLRGRARIYGERLYVHAAERKGEGESHLVGVSMGCGAAVPDIDASLRIMRELGMTTEFNLVDPDEDAKQLAHQLADSEAELDGSLFKDYGNRYPDAYKLGSESVDFVDLLGLWEYLEDKSCVSLLKKSYDLLKTGGVFIASNMMSNRPQLQFNQKGVGWPQIKLRSEEELVDIVIRAGIPLDALKISYTENGVYGVMEVRKL